MDGETLQQKTTHKGRENSTLQDLQRQDSDGESIWKISEQIQDNNGHHGAKAESCHRHCFYILGHTRAKQTGTNPSK